MRCEFARYSKAVSTLRLTSVSVIVLDSTLGPIFVQSEQGFFYFFIFFYSETEFVRDWNK